MCCQAGREMAVRTMMVLPFEARGRLDSNYRMKVRAYIWLESVSGCPKDQSIPITIWIWRGLDCV